MAGAELAIKDITNRLPDIEFDLITVNLDGQQKPQEKIGKVNVYRVGSGKKDKYLFPWQALAKAKQLHQKNKYDIVWAMMANQAGLAALFFKKKFPTVKYLLSLQEGDSLKRIWSRTWFIRPLYKNIFKKADHIQALSNFLSDRAKQYGYQGKVSVIGNGADLANFSKTVNASELEKLRQNLNITKDDKVIISTSRLTYKNGLDILLKAVKEIPVHVLLLGTGELEKSLKSLASELGISNRVHFIGYVSHENFPLYFGISDLFIRPSRTEGLGSSFLEAMAGGLPVIAPPVGGIPDFLHDRKTGLSCQPENSEDLANKIRLIFSDGKLRQEVIANAKKLIEQKYNWDTIAQEMKNIFNTI